MTYEVCFIVYRDVIITVITSIMKYSNKFATYSDNEEVVKLLDNFVRHLYVWRRPYPKFRQSEVSEIYHIAISRYTVHYNDNL